MIWIISFLYFNYFNFFLIISFGFLSIHIYFNIKKYLNNTYLEDLITLSFLFINLLNYFTYN